MKYILKPTDEDLPTFELGSTVKSMQEELAKIWEEKLKTFDWEVEWMLIMLDIKYRNPRSLLYDYNSNLGGDYWLMEIE